MRVLLFCDGGGPLGVGHVMRSLALAEAAVEAGHDVVVAGSFEGSFLRRQLAAAPVAVAPIPARLADGSLRPLIDLAGRVRPQVLHVDSYLELDRLREVLAQAGLGAVAGTMVFSNLEDGAFGRRAADVVVDPTLGAELSPRPQDASSWLLRGSRYTPVRRRVIEASCPEGDGIGDRAPGVARSVLVVMGGTDPVGLAPGAVELLARTGLALDVTAIAVGENAGGARAAAQGSALSLTVLAPVDNLAALMSGHDLVISAAGTSIAELCCLGVPTAVVWAVDNQRAGYDRVVEAGAAIGLGGPGLGKRARAVDLVTDALTDSRVRTALVSAGRHLVDGLGAWRVVRMWEQALDLPTLPALPTTGPGALVARPATCQDSRQLWQWRNDPATRAGSRSSGEVAWDEHQRWFTASLARSDRVLLMVQDPAGPVGTVRWDLRAAGEWEVSITVSPQRRGQRLARPLLRTAEVALNEHVSGVKSPGGAGLTAYLAVVHVENRASVRLFETSAYVPDLPPDPAGFMRFRKVAQVA